MMYYITILNGVAYEILPAKDPAFPGVPIELRYSPEFLSHCVAVPSLKGIQLGMLFDPQSKRFAFEYSDHNPSPAPFSATPNSPPTPSTPSHPPKKRRKPRTPPKT